MLDYCRDALWRKDSVLIRAEGKSLHVLRVLPHCDAGRRLQFPDDAPDLIQHSHQPVHSRRLPSETQVKRGVRVVHGDKELIEELGRNGPVPAGPGASSRSVVFGAGLYDGARRDHFFQRVLVADQGGQDRAAPQICSALWFIYEADHDTYQGPLDGCADGQFQR